MRYTTSNQRQGQRLTIQGISEWSRAIRAQIARYAPFDLNILISGPSGTGKELIARSLHAASHRAGERFVPVDGASLCGELMASQLFGHVKGAFTGASHAAMGCFRAAHAGTIFFDEIGEMDLALQTKLLRVLQERVVLPVGGVEGIPVDVRVVAATNRDLVEEVRRGNFREDLYYRLAVVTVPTLPLAKRPEDIAPLIDEFLHTLAENGMPRKAISTSALSVLEQFSWPGNVRQLRNFLEQAVVSCDEPVITTEKVQSLLGDQVGTLKGKPPSPHTTPPQSLAPALQPLVLPGRQPLLESSDDASLEDDWPTIESVERELLARTLQHTYYNRSAAARLLGISRQALLRKMKKHRITPPRVCSS